MAFMIPEYTKERMWLVETSHGSEVVPANLLPKSWQKEEIITLGPRSEGFDAVFDYLEGSDPGEMKLVKGKWWARLSAPGYLDATEWLGPFNTKKEAEQDIEDTYDVDSDTGDELEENPKRGLVNPKTLPTYSVLHGGRVEQWMNKRGQWVHFKYRAQYKTQQQAIAAVRKFHPRFGNYGLFPNSVPRTFKKKRKVTKRKVTKRKVTKRKVTKRTKNATNVRSLVSRALK